MQGAKGGKTLSCYTHRLRLYAKHDKPLLCWGQAARGRFASHLEVGPQKSGLLSCLLNRQALEQVAGSRRQ